MCFDELMVDVRVVLEIDDESLCGSRNGWWKFVWFDKFMVEVNSYGSTNSWWNKLTGWNSTYAET